MSYLSCHIGGSSPRLIQTRKSQLELRLFSQPPRCPGFDLRRVESSKSDVKSSNLWQRERLFSKRQLADSGFLRENGHFLLRLFPAAERGRDGDGGGERDLFIFPTRRGLQSASRRLMYKTWSGRDAAGDNHLTETFEWRCFSGPSKDLGRVQI